MNAVDTPDEERARQVEAYLAGVREEARAGARRMLLAGAEESEVAAYVASLEPPAPDALEEEPEPHDEEAAVRESEVEREGE